METTTDPGDVKSLPTELLNTFFTIVNYHYPPHVAPELVQQHDATSKEIFLLVAQHQDVSSAQEEEAAVVELIAGLGRTLSTLAALFFRLDLVRTLSRSICLS